MQKIEYQGHMGPAEEVADFLSFAHAEADQWDSFQISVIAESGALNGDISIVIRITKEKYEKGQTPEDGFGLDVAPQKQQGILYGSDGSDG